MTTGIPARCEKVVARERGSGVSLRPAFAPPERDRGSVRHFRPLWNPRFFCSRLHFGPLVERFRMQTT
jgi:hypothetical protein